MVRVLFWKRTPSDTRHSASAIGSLEIPQRGALERCRDADGIGDAEMGNAQGHGITLIYSSGYTRNVRYFD
jgi:hypothetical protein